MMYDVTELLIEGRRDFIGGRIPLIGRIWGICLDVVDVMYAVNYNYLD